MDPREKVALDEPKKFTYVISLLSNEEREQLQLVLLNNINIFSWSHSDMVGINPTVASHKLNITPIASQTGKIESEVFPLGPPSDYLD